MTRQKLREFGWAVLLHSPHSPNLAPSDYHLFLSMANELGSRKLATRESCENWLSEFFENREVSFYYEVGISLGTRHRTKRRIFDLNRIIVTNFMNN